MDKYEQACCIVGLVSRVTRTEPSNSGMIRTYSDAHSLICLPVPSHIKSLFRVSEGAKFIGNRSGTPSFCDFLFFTRRGGSIMPAAWQLDTLCTLRFIPIRADSD